MFGVLCLRGFLFKYWMLIMWYMSPPIYYGFSFSVFSPSSFVHHCFSVSSLFLFQLFPSSLFYSKYYHQLYPFYCYIYHLPSTFFWWFFFDKYFSLRHSASWLVHAPVWHRLVNWGGVIKQLSRHLSQTTGVLHRNLEKLPYLISLRYSKNISICESFCARKS